MCLCVCAYNRIKRTENLHGPKQRRDWSVLSDRARKRNLFFLSRGKNRARDLWSESKGECVSGSVSVCVCENADTDAGFDWRLLSSFHLCFSPSFLSSICPPVMFFCPFFFSLWKWADDDKCHTHCTSGDNTQKIKAESWMTLLTVAVKMLTGKSRKFYHKVPIVLETVIKSLAAILISTYNNIDSFLTKKYNFCSQHCWLVFWIIATASVHTVLTHWIY